MAARTWKQGILAIPGIGVALLPKLACPLCWPAYAGVLSSLGLGFLISTSYLFALTAAFLFLTLASFGFRARQRRGYGPLLLGAASSAVFLTGKFYLASTVVMCLGLGTLVAASMWNVWPRGMVESCPCKVQES